MNQAIRIFLLCVTLGLGAVSCGGVDRGEDCSTSSDCDSGQACVPIAFGCVDSKSCASTCELTCVSDSDCGGGEACDNRNGHLICQSKEPARPWE